MARLVVHNRVRESRQGLGMTQQDLADAVGVSRQSINSIEQGKYVPSLPLALPEGAPAHLLRERPYIPPLSLILFGEGAELDATAALARTMGIATTVFSKDQAASTGPELLRLGGVPPETVRPDPWTAILLLFHDHEWERALLGWALDTPAFYIGAQGGLRARQARLEDLARDGLGPDRLARITSPVGLIPRTREPGVLALSALAEIMGAYEALHPLA